MGKKTAIKIQIAFWMCAMIFSALMGEALIKTFVDFIVCMFCLIFCFGMGLMNFRIYEAEEE